MRLSPRPLIAVLCLFACLGTTLIGSQSWGYATFIGFGYVNCMTCHYNPHGNGQLNDYGRALFASEIAAKPFWNKNATDEELGQKSSFMMEEPTPRSFHPSFKYRDLYLTASPGGTNSYKRYLMQADAGFAYHFDENDKYIFVASAGYTRTPINADIKEGAWNYNLISREHYVRVQVAEEHFISVGLIDVAYGLRLVDHTAVNRRGIGLDQNSQTHGLLYNYFPEKWIIGLHAFAGNQMRDEVTRMSGFSTTIEYELREKLTVGASALNGKTDLQKQLTYSVHSRVGIGKGSSFMTEWGLHKIEPNAGEAMTGAYGVLMGTMRLIRGLDFETQLEMYKADMKDSAENYRYSLGLTYFPFQRVEWRFQCVDSRSLAPAEVKGDAWFAQTQLHLSL
jgi:hypothetical protein